MRSNITVGMADQAAFTGPGKPREMQLDAVAEPMNVNPNADAGHSVSRYHPTALAGT
jgi:hypothetical protein